MSNKKVYFQYLNSDVLKLNEAIDYHWANKFRKFYGTFRSIEITDPTDRTDGPKTQKIGSESGPVRKGPVRLTSLVTTYILKSYVTLKRLKITLCINHP